MLTKYLLRTDILCTGSREFVLYIFFDGEELSLITFVHGQSFSLVIRKRVRAGNFPSHYKELRDISLYTLIAVYLRHVPKGTK